MKNPESDIILRLTFDEGRGAKVRDASGNLPDGDIEYRFLHAAYTRDMEPQWRGCGVKGGCLLFDGSSTAVTYPEDALSLGGGAMTVPRGSPRGPTSGSRRRRPAGATRR